MKHLLRRTFALTAILTFLSASSLQAQEVRSTDLLTLLPGYTAVIVLTPDGVALTLNAPADRWFAIGFNAQNMASGTDVVFYANGSGGVQLYDGRLTGNAPPVEDAIQNWTVIDNTVEDNVRSITAIRPLVTGDNNDFAFDFNAVSLPIIFAHGATASTSLAYHQSNRGASVAVFNDLTSTGKPIALDEKLMLYPNPATTEIYLGMAADVLLTTVRIYDVQARVVKTVNAAGAGEMLTLQVSDLPKGMYYLEANTRNDREVLRFVVE